MKIALTTNEILIPKRFFTPKSEKELELDAPLPDHCPDIARIIKLDCTPFCERCEINDGSASARGRAVCDVLYEAEGKSGLRFVSFTQDFNISCPIPRGKAQSYDAVCKISCEKINCRLLSPRRLIIKATLGGAFECIAETVVKALAVNEDGDAFFCKKTIAFEGKPSRYSETVRISETLPLAQSEKSIGSIVCADVLISPPRITVNRGNAEIRATATVKALCEEESAEGRYFTSAKQLPIVFELANDAIEEFKQISATLAITEKEFAPELDQYGESRSIQARIALLATLNISEPKAYTVAEDMFEKSHDSTPSLSKILFPHTVCSKEIGFSAETKLPPEEEKAISLLDSTARDYGATATKAENGVEISGSFIVTLLTECAEGIQSRDYLLPYSQFIEADLPSGESILIPEVYPIEVIPTLHADGSITVRVIAEAKVCAHGEREEEFITDIPKRTEREKGESGAMLVYCFPQKRESLWSIAKLYRVSPEEIRNANPDSFDDSGISASESPILIKP